MDIKLPSISGQIDLFDQHRAFLRVCRDSRALTFVKLVCDHDTPRSELTEAARIVAEEAPLTTLVVQPVTRASSPIKIDDFLAIQHQLSLVHGDVRLIPQVHALMGMR